MMPCEMLCDRGCSWKNKYNLKHQNVLVYS